MHGAVKKPYGQLERYGIKLKQLHDNTYLHIRIVPCIIELKFKRKKHE